MINYHLYIFMAFKFLFISITIHTNLFSETLDNALLYDIFARLVGLFKLSVQGFEDEYLIGISITGKCEVICT